MKKSELRSLIREEAAHTMLIDRVYDALLKIDEFKRLGMDQQGELSVQVAKLFKKFH